MIHARPIDFGIILAAGGSTRMGHPKALLDYHGDPLVNVHIHHFRTICTNIIVVTGGHAQAIQAVLDPQVKMIHNPQWSTTQMADSLKLALTHCNGLALVTPVDCPPAPTHVLQKLASVGGPAVCTHQGKDGHPVVIRAVQSDENSETLKERLASAIRIPTNWPGVLENWNTPSDLAAYSSSDGFSRN